MRSTSATRMGGGSRPAYSQSAQVQIGDAVEEGYVVGPGVGAQLAGALQGDDVVDEPRRLPVALDALGGNERDQVGGGFLDHREAGQLQARRSTVFPAPGAPVSM